MKSYILSNVKKLYSGKKSDQSALFYNVDVYIENQKITKVIPHTSRNPSGENIVKIDASNYYVTPGLVDAHSHVTLDGLTDSDLTRVNGPAGILYASKNLYRALAFGGVTTIRDMGGATHLLKSLIEAGEVVGPSMQISVCMLCATGGHGDIRGFERCHGEVSKLFPPGPGRPSSIVDGPWEARKRVRELVAVGADFIKICLGKGLSLGNNSDILHQVDFSTEELTAFCNEASNKGLKVAGHAHGTQGLIAAIEAGVKDLQHATFLTEEVTELALKHKCSITPTTWFTKATCKENASRIPNANQILEALHKSIELAKSAGIPILMGFDAVKPGMHGKNYQELSSLESIGLSSLEAWYAATGQASNVLELNNTGTIAEGKNADLLIFNDDVISKTSLFTETSLQEVIKNGFGVKNKLSIPQLNQINALMT